MKKSKKVSVFYIISCLLLFTGLVFGGCYGVYLSVGLKFVRSSVSNFTEGMSAGDARNVSVGGSVNYSTSMVGVIILSIALIVLSIFDFVYLIKQVTFFKQFKPVAESGIVKKVEKKIKSRGKVIFFVFLIDILSLATGVAGIFVNSKSFTSGNFVWIMYVVDGLIALFSLASIVLLIIKLKQAKKLKEEQDKHLQESEKAEKNKADANEEREIDKHLFAENFSNTGSIDELENKLIKLKYLKSAKLISPEEYEKLREKYFYTDKKEEKPSENEEDK